MIKQVDSLKIIQLLFTPTIAKYIFVGMYFFIYISIYYCENCCVFFNIYYLTKLPSLLVNQSA